MVHAVSLSAVPPRLSEALPLRLQAGRGCGRSGRGARWAGGASGSREQSARLASSRLPLEDGAACDSKPDAATASLHAPSARTLLRAPFMRTLNSQQRAAAAL